MLDPAEPDVRDAPLGDEALHEADGGAEDFGGLLKARAAPRDGCAWLWTAMLAGASPPAPAIPEPGGQPTRPVLGPSQGTPSRQPRRSSSKPGGRKNEQWARQRPAQSP